jgi:hypothetical protein
MDYQVVLLPKTFMRSVYCIIAAEDSCHKPALEEPFERFVGCQFTFVPFPGMF